ncbi:MAG: preprotein translocase subunit SecE [Verrucomicrobia bacterium GWF2_51_19]|nr:MAG: preprotein translocase subunit SecE [Verrucomicrobia bacterium GWF2_51_19]HCJ12559.1 preprotein translocase subunit SecE [Opitutae bacterium]
MKNPFKSIRIFWGETLGELKKASWPTQAELKDSTIVVIIGIIILGAFISIVDFSLFQVVDLVCSWVRHSLAG